VDRGIVLDQFRKAVATRQEATIERSKAVLRPDERLLLNALFSEPEIRDEIIRELKTIETIGRLASRRIFQAAFAMADAGAGMRFEEVHARLEEADQNLLAEAVLTGDGEVSREEALAAIAKLRHAEEEHQRSSLKARIKEMERAGNWPEALRLTEELDGKNRRERVR
jgi:hypothetical protein